MSVSLTPKEATICSTQKKLFVTRQKSNGKIFRHRIQNAAGSFYYLTGKKFVQIYFHMSNGERQTL